MNITVGFIANEQEFEELTSLYKPIYRDNYGTHDFHYNGPRIYFYEQYSVDLGCRCGCCEDHFTRFYSSDKELSEIIQKLKHKIETIEFKIKLVEDGKNINQKEITDDYIPEQRFRDWM